LAHLPYDADLADQDIQAFCDAGCILEPTVTLCYHLCWNHSGVGHEMLDRLVGFRNRTFTAIAREFWLEDMQPSVLYGFERARAGQTKVLGFLDMAKILRYYAGIIPTGLNNLRRLLQAGAKMTCSNDAGAVPATEAMLGLELALFDLFFNHDGNQLIDGARALRMATLHGAQALGLEDRLGSIEDGKTADLAVLDGDPLKDVRLIGGQVAALFREGKLVVNRCGLQTVGN
jgi:imidazolonepropionase-like amidohydrolase